MLKQSVKCYGSWRKQISSCQLTVDSWLSHVWSLSVNFKISIGPTHFASKKFNYDPFHTRASPFIVTAKLILTKQSRAFPTPYIIWKSTLRGLTPPANFFLTYLLINKTRLQLMKLRRIVQFDLFLFKQQIVQQYQGLYL